MAQTKIPLSVLKQEKGKECCNCKSEENIQYHHIVPLAAGGCDIISNIVPVCSNCHALIHSKAKMAHSSLIKQGIERARAEGKQIGLRKGTKLNTTKSIKSKDFILNNSKDFNGHMEDKEIINVLSISRNTFYKYKKELREEINSKEGGI